MVVQNNVNSKRPNVHTLANKYIIGAPPANNINSLIKSNEVPYLMNIIPCIVKPVNVSKISDNNALKNIILKLFSLTSISDAMPEFRKFLIENTPQEILRYVNNYIAGKPNIPVYCYMNGSIAETITNSYTQHAFSQFISSLSNVPILGSLLSGARHLFRAFGTNEETIAEGLHYATKYISEAQQQLTKKDKKSNEKEKENNANKAVLDSMNNVKNMLSNPSTSNILSSILVNNIDFPKVWEGSNFSADHTITVKLYNPFPSNDKAYYTYILAPLTILMALAMPHSAIQGTKTGIFVGPPFYIKAEIEGLMYNPYGAITSITINKGGSEGAIAPNGRPIIVEVNMTVSWMYSSLVGSGYQIDTNSMSNYLVNMIKSRENFYVSKSVAINQERRFTDYINRLANAESKTQNTTNNDIAKTAKKETKKDNLPKRTENRPAVDTTHAI